jgi:spore germination cell wall hydrolase CwlJ-like protein
MDAMTDIGTLARTLYGEARGEAFDGKVAIAWVVVNRVRAGRFGATVRDVCLKPRQFSCWNLDDPNRQRIERVTPEDSVFAECLGIAALVYAAFKGRGGALPADLKDATLRSTHYCVSTLKPYWAQGKNPVCTIGRHAFFNDIE